MRNMSFSMTTEQIRNRTKTVTRRLGWLFLKPGEPIQAVEKCQGLKEGEKVVKLLVLRITSIRHEYLDAITLRDVAREGFPQMEPDEFIDKFCEVNKCKPETLITRIAFEYVD